MWNSNLEEKMNNNTNCDSNMTETSLISRNITHHDMNPICGVIDLFNINKDLVFIDKYKNLESVLSGFFDMMLI